MVADKTCALELIGVTVSVDWRRSEEVAVTNKYSAIGQPQGVSQGSQAEPDLQNLCRESRLVSGVTDKFVCLCEMSAIQKTIELRQTSAVRPA